MHLLSDMRIIHYSWHLTKSVARVGEDRHMTTVEHEVAVDSALPESIRPLGTLLYQCATCDLEFRNWEEAKLHISDSSQ
jgi:hypothetical protein